MANALRGHVPLKAGKKSYTLILDINALCMAEAQLGKGGKIGDVIDDLDAGSSLSNLRLMIWAALQRNHPCSLDEAGDIIGVAGVRVASDALIAAIAAAFPSPTEAKDENPQPAVNGAS